MTANLLAGLSLHPDAGLWLTGPALPEKPLLDYPGIGTGRTLRYSFPAGDWRPLFSRPSRRRRTGIIYPADGFVGDGLGVDAPRPD